MSSFAGTAPGKPAPPSGPLYNWQIYHQLRVPLLNCPSSPLPTTKTETTNSETRALGAPEQIEIQMSNYVGINGAYEDPARREFGFPVQPTFWTGFARSLYNGVITSNDDLGSATKFAAITDGLSNTFAVGEQSDYVIDTLNGNAKRDIRASGWYGGAWSGGPGGHDQWWLNVTGIRFPINGLGGAGFGWEQPYYKHTMINSTHAGGAQFLMADGSVQFVSESIDFWTLMALADRRDGVPVGQY